MAYVVTDSCIRCKFMDCVAVCPVDCFYEGENMLVINPDECIDCGVCEPECPAAAIAADTAPEAGPWIALNAHYAALWPNIAEKKEPPADASQWMDVAGKFESAFSPAPGQAASGSSATGAA
ncbi:ferredoxin FdxA [Xanthobacter autotrophicus]|uniref:ferredoxin FdxA n=1 Tax=Xanthobacter autotrophicus TaxID=280 RepID=UPI0037274971